MVRAFVHSYVLQSLVSSHLENHLCPHTTSHLNLFLFGILQTELEVSFTKTVGTMMSETFTSQKDSLNNTVKKMLRKNHALQMWREMAHGDGHMVLEVFAAWRSLSFGDENPRRPSRSAVPADQLRLSLWGKIPRPSMCLLLTTLGEEHSFLLRALE